MSSLSRGVFKSTSVEIAHELLILAEEGGRITGTCSCCLSDYYMVEQRCADTYEVPPDYLSVSWGGEILCQSCQCDGKKCESCGVSEKLVKTH